MPEAQFQTTDRGWFDFMINIGVIGYGYWGPNLVRNFSKVEQASVRAVCDISSANLQKARKKYPQLNATSDFRDIMASGEIDAVAIATPVNTHYELAKNALENGKHVFVEKPFTASSEQAEKLIELADKKRLKIMVDHTFLFTGAVRKIKELIDNKSLGQIYYYDSTRINLGLFQHDVNVVWDLAPHDLSIMDYVIGGKPVAVTANGMDHFKKGIENVAYITIYFDSSMIAHFNVNWLSPVKIRTTLIGGHKKMLVWDDLEADEKIKIYDKGVDIETREGVYNLLVNYRSGDMWSPRLDREEALKVETEYFINCIINDGIPVNDGHAGLRIVRMLESANKSIKRHGEMIEL